MSLTAELQAVFAPVFSEPQDLNQLDRITPYTERKQNAIRADRFMPPSPSILPLVGAGGGSKSLKEIQ